jgi:hypothetical protein
MRHHVQEKRKQLKHPHPRSDNDKRGSRPLRYFSWQQKKLLLNGNDTEFIENKKSAHEVISKSSSSVCGSWLPPAQDNPYFPCFIAITRDTNTSSFY